MGLGAWDWGLEEMNRQARLRTGLWDAKVEKRKDKEGRNRREHRGHREKKIEKIEERTAKPAPLGVAQGSLWLRRVRAEPEPFIPRFRDSG